MVVVKQRRRRLATAKETKIKRDYVVLTVAIDKSLVDLSALWVRSTAESLTRWNLIENTASSER